MADPYATEAPDLSNRPQGAPPWGAGVEERGGVPLGAPDDVERDAAFLVVHCRGVGTLAPLARVDPATAALLWLEHTPAARSAERGNEMLASLGRVEALVLAIKQGCVGGPSDRPGCTAIGAELIGAVLAGIEAGGVIWEPDPDFAYEVPARVPGLDGPAARALMPRLLYADHDRVYEHARLVAGKKRERHDLAAALPGLDPAIAAAAGWPPRPTDWRE